MKNLILILGIIVAIPAISQTKQIVVGNNLHLKSTRDLVLQPGSTGRINLLDTSAVINFVPGPGVTELIYTVPGGTTPTPKPDSVSVDSNPPQTGLTYSPIGWVHSPVNNCCQWFASTLSYNSTIGSFMTYTFTGNKLVWYSERATNKGRVSVQVDNGLVTIVTLTGTQGPDNRTGKPSFIWKGAAGTHTVKITALGGGDIAHDKFVYHFTR